MKLLNNSFFILIITISIVLSLSSCDLLYKYFGIGEHTHRYMLGDEEIIKEPTCFEDGQRKWTCTICGEVNIESITSLGRHTESDWIVDSEESEENDGASHTECLVCGEIMQTEVKHNLLDPVEILAPTLLEPGLSVIKCTRCDYTEEHKVSPLLIFTLNDDEYSVKANSAAKKYDEIVIPDTYNGLKVTEIEDRAFMDFNNVSKIVIGENIEKIGESAFWNCESIKSINIPASVESIGKDAFIGCESLSGVYITDIGSWCIIDFWPSYSYDYPTYPSNPLSFCDNLYLNGELLTDVIVPDDVTVLMPYVFSSSMIESVTLGKNITNIYSSAFEGCSSISTITLPSSLKEIESGAFAGCTGIIEVINLSSLDIVAGSTEHGGVARYALTVSSSESKTEIIDDYTFITIDDVNYLIAYKGKEKILTLPKDYNGEKYEIYKNAFAGRNELISVTIPEAVTNIGDNAFSDCYSLVEVINHSNLSIRRGETSYGRIAEYAKTVHSLDSSVLIDINGYIFYEKYGDIEYIGYNGEGTELILPENCNGDNYTIYEYAFAYHKDVTSVVWPSHLTEIPAQIFQSCSSLKSITIPSNVVKIGWQAFSECFSLENVYITDLEAFINISCDIDEYSYNDHPLYYADNLYLNGELLTEVVIPDGIKTIPAFSLSFKFTDITIPDSVKEFETNAFYNCVAIQNVYISDLYDWCNITVGGEWSHPLEYGDYLYLNGELIDELVIPHGVVTIPSYAFSCNHITKVTIPEGVSEIGFAAFSICTALKSINLPGSIKTINSYAFEECKNLDNVYITDLVDFLSISIVGFSNTLFESPYDLYLNGVKLTDIVIPEGITQISIHNLRYCNIESVSFPKSIKKIEGTLYGNECFKSIFVEDLASWCSVEFVNTIILEQVYDLYVNGILVEKLKIPEGVTKINEGIFAYSSITDLTVPETLTIIGDSAFNECQNLKKATLTDNVFYIGDYAFSNCAELIEVSVFKDISTSAEFIPRDENDVPMIGESAFSLCEALEKVTIPNRIELIQSYVFSDCTNLKEVVLPINVTYIADNAFENCNSDVFNEYEGGKYIGNRESPYGVLVEIINKELSQYTIHNDTKMISGFAFASCTNLTSIEIPAGVKVIGEYAFADCTSLTSVVIPNSVYDLGAGAFAGCTALRSITLGYCGGYINPYTFCDCNNLTDVYYTGENWNSIEVGTDNDPLKNATVHLV